MRLTKLFASTALALSFATIAHAADPDLTVFDWAGFENQSLIEAYVGESSIESVHVGQEVKFVSSRADAPSIRGVVKSIDTTGSKQVGRPLLVSPHGGEIAAVLDRRGGAQAQDPVYRVLIEPVGEVGGVASIERGTVRIETSLVLVGKNFASRALSIFVRESGF